CGQLVCADAPVADVARTCSLLTREETTLVRAAAESDTRRVTARCRMLPTDRSPLWRAAISRAGRSRTRTAAHATRPSRTRPTPTPGRYWACAWKRVSLMPPAPH